MPSGKAKSIGCICGKQGCWIGEDKGIPDYCQANSYLDELEASKREYAKLENKDIYKAACVVGAEKDGFRPRVEEVLHYCKELSIKKIGFAACIALQNEMRVIKQLFSKNGLSTYCVAWSIGRVSA